MNKQIIITVILLFAFNCSTYKYFSFKDKQLKIPVYHCNKILNPIIIDGNITAYEWSEARIIRKLFDNNTGKNGVVKTSVRCLYDLNYLYLSFECYDTNIISPVKERDSNIWAYDAVETFIDVDGDGKHYYEIEVSPYNVIFDAYITFADSIDFDKAKKFDFKNLKSSVQIKDNYWSVELRVTFSDLKISNLKQFKINFYRINRDKEKGKLEFSAWSPTGSWFHVPEKFGIINFDL